MDVNSTNAAPSYTNWITAATNIQDAVDAAVAGDEIMVSDGIYTTGGRSMDGFTTNRVAVDKPLNVRSVNGPQSTTIVGGGVRCVHLTNGATLSGFTLSNGVANLGGGLWCESTNAVVSNCVLSGNYAYGFNGGSAGGGAYGGTLNNCILSENLAKGFPHDIGFGGGACNATFNNCALMGHWAYEGGGAHSCTLNNCNLTDNSTYSGNISFGGRATCCTLNNCILTGNSADGGNNGYGGGAYISTLNNCTLIGNSADRWGGGAAGCTLNNCVVDSDARSQV